MSKSKFTSEMNTSIRRQFIFQLSNRQLEIQGSPRDPREVLVFSNAPKKPGRFSFPKKPWQIPISQECLN